MNNMTTSDQVQPRLFTACPTSYLAPEGEAGKDWHVFANQLCVDSLVVISDDGKSFSLKESQAGWAVCVLCMTASHYPVSPDSSFWMRW